MKAEALLALYERVADSPDAIVRLRRFVLDLAVRGKLVERDVEDEPASELLKRLETARRATAIGRSSGAPLDPCSPDLRIGHAPDHWHWVSLGQIGRLSGGMTPSKASPSYWDGEVVWLSPKDIKANELYDSELKITEKGLQETRLELYPPGSLFIVARSGILKRTLPVAINRVPAASNQDLKVLVPHLPGLERFLQLLLRGFEPFILSELVKTGTTVQSLKYEEFEAQAFPLPPLAEQYRIVAKVDELMTLLDRLDAARSAREATRDRFTTASLARLSDPDNDPETFHTHARFALDALPALTSREKNIQELRRLILDLAVKGQLVEQRPEEGSATVELVAIGMQKEALRSEGKFKPFDGTLDRSENVQPFAIPDGWAWCYLDDIAAVGRGGSPRPIQSFLTKDEDGIPWIKIGDSTRGSIYIDEAEERIKPSGLAKSRLVVPGDLLLSNSMSFGFPYITRVSGCIHDGWLVIRTPERLVSKLYLHKLFLSNYSSKAFAKAAAGAVVQNLNADKVRQLAVPLPPLAEQQRIVAKVDELMGLCDRLEVALQTADTKRAQLLEALIDEALASDSTERKAA